jgi:hypothetical protein
VSTKGSGSRGKRADQKIKLPASPPPVSPAGKNCGPAYCTRRPCPCFGCSLREWCGLGWPNPTQDWLDSFLAQHSTRTHDLNNDVQGLIRQRTSIFSSPSFLRSLAGISPAPAWPFRIPHFGKGGRGGIFNSLSINTPQQVSQNPSSSHAPSAPQHEKNPRQKNPCSYSTIGVSLIPVRPIGKVARRYTEPREPLSACRATTK